MLRVGERRGSESGRPYGRPKLGVWSKPRVEIGGMAGQWFAMSPC